MDVKLGKYRFKFVTGRLCSDVEFIRQNVETFAGSYPSRQAGFGCAKGEVSTKHAFRRLRMHIQINEL